MPFCGTLVKTLQSHIFVAIAHSCKRPQALFRGTIGNFMHLVSFHVDGNQKECGKAVYARYSLVIVVIINLYWSVFALGFAKKRPGPLSFKMLR